jgi:hypothetical protein
MGLSLVWTVSVVKAGRYKRCGIQRGLVSGALQPQLFVLLFQPGQLWSSYKNRAKLKSVLGYWLLGSRMSRRLLFTMSPVIPQYQSSGRVQVQDAAIIGAGEPSYI